jgi:hypothetical protein
MVPVIGALIRDSTASRISCLLTPFDFGAARLAQGDTNSPFDKLRVTRPFDFGAARHAQGDTNSPFDKLRVTRGAALRQAQGDTTTARS